MKQEEMKLSRYVIKLAVTMIGGIALLFTLLVLAWCIPDEWVVKKQQESLMVYEEGDVHEWPFTRETLEGGLGEWVFTHSRGSQLDNEDYRMLSKVIAEDSNASALYKAMDCSDYARYWHGYLAFLRPMLIVFSYLQIRYIYMFIHLLLGAAIMMRIYRNFGSHMVYLWVFSLCFVYPVILPFSMHYSSVFFIAMIGLLVIDKKYRGYDWQQAGNIFIVLGMLTTYFDLLTAPLLTLGVPLLYLMLLNYYKYREDSMRKNISILASATVTWCVGYFGCWFTKWVIASPVVGYNVILDGLSTGIRRTVSVYHMETLDYDTGIVRAIAMNLFSILPPGITSSDWRWFSIVVLVIILVLAAIFIKYHVDKKNMKPLLPFVMIAFYPFVWFMVLSNLTSIHFPFTYRILLISLLGFLIAYCQSLKFMNINKEVKSEI